MKGLIAFDKLNDVLFLGCDDDFKTYIERHALRVGLATSTSTLAKNELDENVIVQLFSPIISSQRVLIEDMNNPYASITCENGMLFVFKQFGDQIHLAINGDGSETESYLNKKLAIFQRIVGFLYGPVINGIRSESHQLRQHTWNTLYKLVLTWERLYWTQQAFLMEAIERLSLNQTMNGECLELLQSVTESMLSAGDKNVQHCLLFVDSKLLSLYSRKNAAELQSMDLSTIILLVQNQLPASEVDDTRHGSDREKFQSTTRGDSSTSASTTSETNVEQTLSSADAAYSSSSVSKISTEADIIKKSSDSSSSGSDGAFKDSTSAPITELVCSTVVEEGRASDSGDPGSGQNNEEYDSEVEYFSPRASPVPPKAGHPETGLSRNESFLQSNFTVSSVTSDESSMTFQPKMTSSTTALPKAWVAAPSLDIANDSWRQQQMKEHYLRFTVFLPTPLCQYTPHLLYCVQIFPGIVLAIITQVARASMSGLLCKILGIIRDIKLTSSSRLMQQHGGSVYDVLDNKIDKLPGVLRRGNLSEAGEKLLQDIRRRWSEAKSNHLLAYLEGGAKGFPGPRLDSLLSALYSKVCSLFRLVYLTHHQTPRSVYKTIMSSKITLQSYLQDFREYLLVKASRNIAMTNYINDYPGLVHFIYVNRISNLITAPSLEPSVTLRTPESKDPSSWLRSKIWEHVDWMMSRVTDGVTSISARHGDFQYSLFLWFEDNSGRSVDPQVALTANMCHPATLTSRNFYTQIVQRCFPSCVPGEIHCYQLFTVHIAVVPAAYITQHWHQLSSALWETTAESFSPISLL